MNLLNMINTWSFSLGNSNNERISNTKILSALTALTTAAMMQRVVVSLKTSIWITAISSIVPGTLALLALLLVMKEKGKKAQFLDYADFMMFSLVAAVLVLTPCMPVTPFVRSMMILNVYNMLSPIARIIEVANGRLLDTDVLKKGSNQFIDQLLLLAREFTPQKIANTPHFGMHGNAPGLK